VGNWKKTKIGEFLFEREGKYKPDAQTISALKRIHKIDFTGNFHIASKPSKTNMILVCPGDLVISGINVAKGAMGLYHGKEDVTATIHYSSYTFDESKIDVEYFKRFLKSAEFIKLLQKQVKGGIKTEIKPKHILPLEIDLPDIEEQKEIVTHFKSIETEDGELKDELTHQQTLLKKLRQQILQEAIEGKLTADWRAKNPDVEPASELLARIQAEKQQLIKDKKIKKQKPLPAISEDEKPFALPEGWNFYFLDEITYMTRGSSPRPIVEYITDRIDGVNWIKIGDTKNVAKYITSTRQKITKEGAKKSQRVEIGDFILSNSMSYGKPFIMKIEGYIHDGWFLIKLLGDIDVNYFYYLLLSNVAQSQFLELASGAVVKNIRAEIVKKTILPLPPLSEQKAIVAKVEKLLSVCDQLETQITHNQNHANALMQAVLKEAFTQTAEQTKPVAANA